MALTSGAARFPQGEQLRCHWRDPRSHDRETRKGKGNVVRRAFADLDADIYLLIAGDDTYDAARAPDLVRTLVEGPFDHVVGARTQTTRTAYRPGHAFGNRLFTGFAAALFGRQITDMLSGYRAFSRRYVKSFPPPRTSSRSRRR